MRVYARCASLCVSPPSPAILIATLRRATYFTAAAAGQRPEEHGQRSGRPSQPRPSSVGSVRKDNDRVGDVALPVAVRIPSEKEPRDFVPGGAGNDLEAPHLHEI